MGLTRDIASIIVQKLITTINHHINIMDEHGVVIASSDEKRIDTIHTGAVEVIRNRKPFIVQEETVKEHPGTKPGVNLPIEFMDEIIGVVGITGNPEELLKLAQVTKITVELIIQQNYMKQHTYFERQLMQSWVMELISPELTDVKKLEKQAKHFLQMDINKLHAVILLNIPYLQETVKLEDLWTKNERKEEVLKMIQTAHKDIAFLGITNEELVVIGIPTTKWKEELKAAKDLLQTLKSTNNKVFAKSSIGVGNSKQGIENIRDSYLEANRSIQLMGKFGNVDSITHIQDWGFIRLLDDISPRLREEMMLEYKLDKLPPHLTETLKLLIHTDHNVKLTAEKLHIHRNTLNYRLDTIEQITGLHPKTIDGITMLNMLLLFEKLK